MTYNIEFQIAALAFAILITVHFSGTDENGQQTVRFLQISQYSPYFSQSMI